MVPGRRFPLSNVRPENRAETPSRIQLHGAIVLWSVLSCKLRAYQFEQEGAIQSSKVKIDISGLVTVDI